MYAMPKIHVSNNILAKTRRGFPQKLETFEKNFKENTSFLINTPKPVFHFSNSKKFKEYPHQKTGLNPQHEEMVKYIQSTWTNVIEQYESKEPKLDTNDLNNNSKVCVNNNAIQKTNVPKISYFSSKTAAIPKFEPFDLESFWSEKIYQRLISA